MRFVPVGNNSMFYTFSVLDKRLTTLNKPFYFEEMFCFNYFNFLNW